MRPRQGLAWDASPPAARNRALPAIGAPCTLRPADQALARPERLGLRGEGRRPATAAARASERASTEGGSEHDDARGGWRWRGRGDRCALICVVPSVGVMDHGGRGDDDDTGRGSGSGEGTLGAERTARGADFCDADTLACYENATTSAMNISMELDFEDQGVGRSREPCGISQQMDFSRDSDQIGENGVNAELCSPGPATPIQVVPLPQQKPREASKSCPNTATIRVMHPFEAAKSSCEPQLASETLKSVPASTQDIPESESENVPPLTTSIEHSVGGSQALEPVSPLSGAVKHGHPSLRGGLAIMGGPTKAVLKDEIEVRVASKREEEASMSGCNAVERACSDRSMTSMGCPSSRVELESSRYAVDAGLSLGSNAVQFSGSKEGSCVDFSRVWENVGGSGGRSGDSFAVSSRDKGAVVLQLSQGGDASAQVEKGEVGMGGKWKGKHLQLSIGLEAEEKVGGRVDGNMEHRFSEVLEENVGIVVEHGAKGCTDPSEDRLTKRVKREVVETRLSVDESREQLWERIEDQDRLRSGTYENKQEDFRSLFWGNGGAALFPQSYREKVVGKILEVGIGEPKTMVLKKTPKRVHNSDPSAMFTRSELLMFEDSMRSPGSVSHAMFTSSNKQGMNGTMPVSDLVDSGRQRLYRESANLVCGPERGVEHSNCVQDGCSVMQSQLESRLDRGSPCSLMSTSKHALLMREPSLPLSLNFSPKPQRPVVSNSRTSTEEEWGKSLALCGPGAQSPGVVERFGEEAKILSFQERFVQLQLFLKKCDEDDQSYLLDALRSLSAAGRSSHAVGLEQRALWLSIEEGKEMTRLKSLNVMGQRSSLKGHSEVGCTPEGRRVTCFGSDAEHAQQQSLTKMRSPQMQMLRSGSMPGSGYKESYHPG